jgi:hypothetical protein
LANIFGIDDDENFGLINKMNKVLTNNKKNDFNNQSKLLLNDSLSMKEVNRSNFLSKAENDSIFPVNLSNIEMNKSSNENILSTDRGRIMLDKKLHVLKG